jgi:hypothetical protein
MKSIKIGTNFVGLNKGSFRERGLNRTLLHKPYKKFHIRNKNWCDGFFDKNKDWWFTPNIFKWLIKLKRRR